MSYVPMNLSVDATANSKVPAKSKTSKKSKLMIYGLIASSLAVAVYLWILSQKKR